MAQLLVICSSVGLSGSISREMVASVASDDDTFARAKTEIATTAQAVSGQKLAA